MKNGTHGRMGRVLLSVLVCLSIVFSVISIAPSYQVNAMTDSEIQTYMQNKMKQTGFKPGSAPPSSYAHGATCYGFVSTLTKELFGVNLPSIANTVYQLSPSNNFVQVGSTLTIRAGNLNTTTLKELFLQARPGDVVQLDYTKDDGTDSRHTMMVYSVSSEGVVFYHAGSSKVYYGAMWTTGGGTMKWSTFLNFLKNSDDGISVYRATSQAPAFSMATLPGTINVGYYNLTWTAAPNATAYEIWMSTPSNPTEHWVVSTNGLSYNFYFGEVGNYSITLRATNGSNVRLLGYYVGTTVVNPTPGSFSITNPGTIPVGNNTLSWGASSNASSYELWIKKPSSSSFSKVYSGTSRSYTYNFDEIGTYSAYVRAINSSGSSSTSTISIRACQFRWYNSDVSSTGARFAVNVSYIDFDMIGNNASAYYEVYKDGTLMYRSSSSSAYRVEGYYDSTHGNPTLVHGNLPTGKYSVTFYSSTGRIYGEEIQVFNTYFDPNDISNASFSACTLYNNHLYMAFEVEANWESAEQFAQLLGGHLASINSAEENRIVNNLISSCSWKAFNLGGSDRVQDGAWTWSDGSTFDYTNWAQDEPNGGWLESYIMMYAYTDTSASTVISGAWNDYSGSSNGGYIGNVGFVVEVDLDEVAENTYDYQNQSYTSYALPLTWNNASEVAELLGGHLAIVHNEDVQNGLTEMLSSGSSYPGYYLGGNDRTTEGDWKWVDGSTINQFYWEEGQPDNLVGNQDVLQMISRNGHWDDCFDNSNTIGFILETDEDFYVEAHEVEYVPGDARMYELDTYNYTGSELRVSLPVGPHLANSGTLLPDHNVYRVGLASGSNGFSVFYPYRDRTETVFYSNVDDSTGPSISNFEYSVENNCLSVEMDVSDPSGVLIYEDGLLSILKCDGEFVSNDLTYNIYGLDIGENGSEHYSSSHNPISNTIEVTSFMNRHEGCGRATVSDLTSTSVHYSFDIDISNLELSDGEYQLYVGVYDAYINHTTETFTVDLQPEPVPTVTPEVTPSVTPAVTPSTQPTGNPTVAPTVVPTVVPTRVPTVNPTVVPTVRPTAAPTTRPTVAPTAVPTTAPQTSSAGTEGFVERLYSLVLGRPADQGGKDYWIGNIQNGMTGADVAGGFLYSPEFLNSGISDSDFVEILYNVFFDRASDAGGKDYWLTNMANGMSRMNVIGGFINSTEWANVCLSYGIPSGGTGVANISIEPNANIISFATRLYTTCLCRNADQGGLMDWSYRLANQQISGSQAAHGFFFSGEFVGDTSIDNAEYVNRLYRTFMDRPADQGGFDYWMGQFANGATREDVFNGFAGSQEWAGICASYGILK